MGISKSRLLFVLIATLFFGVNVHAQQPSSNTQAQLATASAPLATVNIQNARIISQDSHTLVVGFDLTNRVGVQPHVRYSIQLIGTNATGGRFIADEYIFPDDVSLNENTDVPKQITYVAPPSLKGKFEVYLQSKSDTGFPLAVSDVGKATFETATSGFEVIENTCYLSIQGEKGSPKYTLLQGVDIKPTETLVLHCNIANYAGVAALLTPQYQTHYRSPYGNVVVADGGDVSPIMLKAKEVKPFSFVLPKATDPQAYDILFSVSSGNVTSNTTDVHYVLQGTSATVQTITLDRDYYTRGDVANMSFVWSPSADRFSGARAGTSSVSMTIVTATLQSGAALCGDQVTRPLTQNLQVQIQVPVTRSCTNPHITIQLRSPEGAVLATGELTRASKPQASLLTVGIAGSVVLLLLLGILSWTVLVKRRRANRI